MMGRLYWKFHSFLILFFFLIIHFVICNGRTLLQEKELEDENIFSCIWIHPKDASSSEVVCLIITHWDVRE